MKLSWTTAALAAALAGCSQAGSGPEANAPTPSQVAAIATSQGPTHTSHLVSDPASCAPDRADPIWGPGQQLLGYSCYRNPTLGY